MKKRTKIIISTVSSVAVVASALALTVCLSAYNKDKKIIKNANVANCKSVLSNYGNGLNYFASSSNEEFVGFIDNSKEKKELQKNIEQIKSCKDLILVYYNKDKKENIYYKPTKDYTFSKLVNKNNKLIPLFVKKESKSNNDDIKEKEEDITINNSDVKDNQSENISNESNNASFVKQEDNENKISNVQDSSLIEKEDSNKNSNLSLSENLGSIKEDNKVDNNSIDSLSDPKSNKGILDDKNSNGKCDVLEQSSVDNKNSLEKSLVVSDLATNSNIKSSVELTFIDNKILPSSKVSASLIEKKDKTLTFKFDTTNFESYLFLTKIEIKNKDNGSSFLDQKQFITNGFTLSLESELFNNKNDQIEVIFHLNIAFMVGKNINKFLDVDAYNDYFIVNNNYKYILVSDLPKLLTDRIKIRPDYLNDKYSFNNYKISLFSTINRNKNNEILYKDNFLYSLHTEFDGKYIEVKNNIDNKLITDSLKKIILDYSAVNDESLFFSNVSGYKLIGECKDEVIKSHYLNNFINHNPLLVAIYNTNNDIVYNYLYNEEQEFDINEIKKYNNNEYSIFYYIANKDIISSFKNFKNQTKIFNYSINKSQIKFLFYFSDTSKYNILKDINSDELSTEFNEQKKSFIFVRKCKNSVNYTSDIQKHKPMFTSNVHTLTESPKWASWFYFDIDKNNYVILSDTKKLSNKKNCEVFSKINKKYEECFHLYNDLINNNSFKENHISDNGVYNLSKDITWDEKLIINKFDSNSKFVLITDDTNSFFFKCFDKLQKFVNSL